MLGGLIPTQVGERWPERLITPEVAATAREADVVLLNLGSVISERVRPESGPRTPLFHAPPAAVDVLGYLGVNCVTMTSRHLMEAGPQALIETFERLDAAGIRWVGAGVNERAARAPSMLTRAGSTVGVLAVTDRAFGAAGPDSPGVAYCDLEHGIPDWLNSAIRAMAVDSVLIAPRWGPAIKPRPVPHVERAAVALRAAGADIVAGICGHSVQGAGEGILYSVGNLLRRTTVDPEALNDFGFLFLITLDGHTLVEVEAVPLALDCGHTRLAQPTESVWIHRHFRAACASLGSTVDQRDGRLLLRWNPHAA